MSLIRVLRILENKESLSPGTWSHWYHDDIPAVELLAARGLAEIGRRTLSTTGSTTAHLEARIIPRITP